MTQNTVPLPEPVALVVQKVIRGRKGAPDTYKYDFVLCDPTLRPCKLYTADQMHAHAAKVCAEKDAEIEQIEATARIRRVRNEVLEAELTTLRTAAQQALEALKGWPGKPRAAFEILTAALESK